RGASLLLRPFAIPDPGMALDDRLIRFELIRFELIRFEPWQLSAGYSMNAARLQTRTSASPA
ncbi:MAG: hypothetical protein ABSB35_42585, partial [Bryobacteraceae bacterium]